MEMYKLEENQFYVGEDGCMVVLVVFTKFIKILRLILTLSSPQIFLLYTSPVSNKLSFTEDGATLTVSISEARLLSVPSSIN
jgi:hypothetical protein